MIFDFPKDAWSSVTAKLSYVTSGINQCIKHEYKEDNLGLLFHATLCTEWALCIQVQVKVFFIIWNSNELSDLGPNYGGNYVYPYVWSQPLKSTAAFQLTVPAFHFKEFGAICSQHELTLEFRVHLNSLNSPIFRGRKLLFFRLTN